MATDSLQTQLSKALPGSIAWAIRGADYFKYVKTAENEWQTESGKIVPSRQLGLTEIWMWTVYPTVHSTLTEEELERARPGAKIQTFAKGVPTEWTKTGYDSWKATDGRLRSAEEIAKLPFVFTEFPAFPDIPPAPARMPKGILLTKDDIRLALDGTIIHIYRDDTLAWTTWKAEGEWWTAEKGVVGTDDVDSIIDFYFDANSGYYAICTDYPTTKEAPSVDPTVSLYDIQQAAFGSTFLTSAVADKTYRKTAHNTWVVSGTAAPAYTDNQLAAWTRPGARLMQPAVSMPTSDLLAALNDKHPRVTPVPVPVPVTTEPPMANIPTPTPASAAADTFDMLKEATSTGLKAGVASELADRLVEKIEENFGSNPLYPAMLKSPLGRRGLSYAAPVLLFFLASAFPERLPIDPEGVKAAARYAVVGHSVKIVTPLFSLLTPLWHELANFATTEKLRGVPGGKS